MLLTSRHQARSLPAHDDVPSARADMRVLTAAVIGVALVTAGVQFAHVMVGAWLAFLVAVTVGAAIGHLGRERATPSWIGAVGWVTGSVAATAVVLQLAGTEQDTTTLTLVAVTAGAVATISQWAAHQLRTEEFPDASALWPAARRILARPTTGLAPAVIGAGMSLPLVGAYGPNIWDSDSIWMTAAMQHVREEEGVELLRLTHDAYLPHLTISPLIGLAGHQGAMIFTIVTMIVFVALTAYLAYRIVGNGLASMVAAAVVLAMPGITHQVDYYPMYALAYTLGYGSGWLVHLAMGGHRRSTLVAVIAGVGLALTYEAHSAFMVFVLVPPLLLLLHPWRQARKPFFITVVAMGVASLPRAWLNFSIGGFEGIRTMYNNTWFIQQGYLRDINQNMFEQNVDKSPLVYAENLRYLAEDAVGGLGLLLLLGIPVIFAARQATKRARLFVVVTATIFIAALVVAGPGVYSRYVSPLGAGLAVIVAVGLSHLVKEGGSARVIAMILVGILLVGAAREVLFQVEEKSRLHRQEATNSYAQVGDLVDDERYVLGARSAQLTRSDGNMRTLSPRTMTEEDFIIFASWPDDETVREMVERLDVGWIYVRPLVRYEVEYHNSWLEPNYGLSVRHPLAVAASDDFCLVADIQGHRLYRYGECRPGDEETIEDLGSEDPDLNPFREAMGLEPVSDPEEDEDNLVGAPTRQ